MRGKVMIAAAVCVLVVAAAVLWSRVGEWSAGAQQEEPATFVRYTEGKANTRAAIVSIDGVDNGEPVRVQCEIEGLKPGDRVRVQLVGAEDGILDERWVVGRAR